DRPRIEDVLLDLLHALDHHGVVLKITSQARDEAAELLAGLVVRVGPHRGGKVHDLAVDAVADELANKAGRPARGALVDEVDDEILRLAGLIVHPDDGRVHQWLGAAFVDELLESAPHRRTPRWFAEADDDHLATGDLDFLGVNPV